MSGLTPYLSMYLPGGGSSGTYGPDETVDIDRLNNNFELLDGKLEQYTKDTGWSNVPLVSGFTQESGNELQSCKIGPMVYLRGRVNGNFTHGTKFGTLAAAFRPARAQFLTVARTSGTSPASPVCRVDVLTDGSLEVYHQAGTGVTNPTWLGFNASFFI